MIRCDLMSPRHDFEVSQMDMIYGWYVSTWPNFMFVPNLHVCRIVSLKHLVFFFGGGPMIDRIWFRELAIMVNWSAQISELVSCRPIQWIFRINPGFYVGHWLVEWWIGGSFFIDSPILTSIVSGRLIHHWTSNDSTFTIQKTQQKTLVVTVELHFCLG